MNKKFRKAVDANAMVIFAAVGVIVLIGLYYVSKDTMSSVSSTQHNANNALMEGIDKLKN